MNKTIFNKPQCFIFIGRSGCGKGTQAKLLMDFLKKDNPNRGILYIQTGQELREFIKGESVTQKLSRKAYEDDVLQPEFVALYQWIRLLIEKYEEGMHIIFDGTPRRLHEAGVVSSLIPFYGFDNPWVINIDVSREEAKKRLALRKRMDDKADDVEKRLNWYDIEVVPTIEYFVANPLYKFAGISGEQSIEDVFKDIANLFETDLPI